MTTSDVPTATVTMYPDGPLVLRGDVDVLDADGNAVELPGHVVALCRCGKSAVQPFCDGNHRRGPGKRSS